MCLNVFRVGVSMSFRFSFLWSALLNLYIVSHLPLVARLSHRPFDTVNLFKDNGQCWCCVC